jgi:purine nucleoside phosphorylase
MSQAAFDAASEAAESIRKHLKSDLANPNIAVICGSGLGGLADSVDTEDKVEIPYKDIPHFAVSTGIDNSRQAGLDLQGCSAWSCWKAAVRKDRT